MASTDFTLDSLFADPITCAAMAADGIDPRAFRELFESVSHRRRTAEPMSRSQASAKYHTTMASIDACREALTRWSDSLCVSANPA